MVRVTQNMITESLHESVNARLVVLGVMDVQLEVRLYHNDLFTRAVRLLLFNIVKSMNHVRDVNGGPFGTLPLQDHQYGACR